MVIAAMNWGGILTVIPAGFLADRYSPKLIVTASLSLSFIGCMLTHVTAIYLKLWGIFVVRFLMGLMGQVRSCFAFIF